MWNMSKDRKTVDDVVLGRIYRKQDELMQRIKNGTLPPWDTERNMQCVIEGQKAMVFNEKSVFPIDVNEVDFNTSKKLLYWNVGKYTVRHFFEFSSPSERRKTTKDIYERPCSNSIKIVYCGSQMTTEEILLKIEEKNLLPATYLEFTAFAQRYMYAMTNSILGGIIALGSKITMFGEEYSIGIDFQACWKSKEEDEKKGRFPRINLSEYSDGYYGSWYFACVDKV